MLTAGNLISNNSVLLGTCNLNSQKSQQVLQELMPVLLLEPVCKSCQTGCVGGAHRLSQRALFAGVTKGPAKDPTEMVP